LAEPTYAATPSASTDLKGKKIGQPGPGGFDVWRLLGADTRHHSAA
jgi:hypothetical protein